MIRDDEFLERVVAGIHAVTTTGADVVWNEVINDRQFDVVVRFKVGTLQYLVLIEVKNRTRKASASDMDAFVCKARDQNASKAVFVTAAGYQEGAIAVAKRHAVDIFTVTFDDAQWRMSPTASYVTLGKKDASPREAPHLSIGDPALILNIDRIILRYRNGSRVDMPDEQSQMNYYLRKTVLQDGRTLQSVIETAPLPDLRLGEIRQEDIWLHPPQSMIPPDDYFYPSGIISTLQCFLSGQQGRPLRGNIQIDPNVFTIPVVYTNVITGDSVQFAIDQLPLGLSRVSVGGYYFQPFPLRYYYCAAIQGSSVRWHIVESFQNGERLNTSYTQEIKYSIHYIPVSDKKILNRLRKRLDDYLKLLNNDRK